MKIGFPKKFKISIYIEDLDEDFYLQRDVDGSLIWHLCDRTKAEYHQEAMVNAILEYPFRTVHQENGNFYKAFPTKSRYSIRITPYRLELIEETSTIHDGGDIKKLATKKKLNKFFDTLKPEELAIAKELIKELK